MRCHRQSTQSGDTRNKSKERKEEEEGEREGEVSKRERERSNRRRSSPHSAQIARGGKTFTFPLTPLTAVKCKEQHLKNVPVKILKLCKGKEQFPIVNLT